jgi:hypothetical protein
MNRICMIVPELIIKPTISSLTPILPFLIQSIKEMVEEETTKMTSCDILIVFLRPKVKSNVSLYLLTSRGP